MIKDKQRLLFICTSAMDRSPAAAELFKNSEEYEAKYVGISPGAIIPLKKEAIEWADTIFTMEPEHQRFVLEKFGKEIQAGNKKVILLDVDNNFKRHDRALEELLVSDGHPNHLIEDCSAIRQKHVPPSDVIHRSQERRLNF